MATYDKEKLLENDELLEDIGNKIWLFEKQYAGEYEVVESKRQEFLEALNLILYTTSGVFDEREITDIDVSPENDECLIEVTIDIFEVGSENVAKLSKVLSNAIGFYVKTAEDSDEDDPFITLGIKTRSIWRKI